jgi:hypothetical protein
VLYVASFALLILVVFFVGPVLEPDIAFWSAGHLTWMTVVLAGYALAFAILRDSAVCTLIGALTGGVAVLAAASWIGLVASPEAVRRILLGLMLVYAIAAVGQRDRRLRHGVALIDAAGLASLVIAAIPVATSILVGLIAEGPVDEQDRVSVGVGWGWELLLVATGFGLIAYSSVDRQPGPAYLGVLNLVAFAGWTASGHTTLLGWPIVLALAAAALLAIGLRPTVPAPPAPDVDVPEPPPLPWR